MKLEMNDWGELIIDLGSLGFWITTGEPSDDHAPTGACIEIDSENVHIKLTPENAKRLAKALLLAQLKFKADPDNFDYVGARFVRPD